MNDIAKRVAEVTSKVPVPEAPSPGPVKVITMTAEDLVSTERVNEHRAALGHPPLERADARELLLVEACAEYGEDRWSEGVLKEVLDLLPNTRLMRMIEEGDPDVLHDDLHEPDGAFAEVWREAERRGLLERG